MEKERFFAAKIHGFQAPLPARSHAEQSFLADARFDLALSEEYHISSTALRPDKMWSEEQAEPKLPDSAQSLRKPSDGNDSPGRPPQHSTTHHDLDRHLQLLSKLAQLTYAAIGITLMHVATFENITTDVKQRLFVIAATSIIAGVAHAASGHRPTPSS